MRRLSSCVPAVVPVALLDRLSEWSVLSPTTLDPTRSAPRLLVRTTGEIGGA